MERDKSIYSDQYKIQQTMATSAQYQMLLRWMDSLDSLPPQVDNQPLLSIKTPLGRLLALLLAAMPNSLLAMLEILLRQITQQLEESSTPMPMAFFSKQRQEIVASVFNP